MELVCRTSLEDEKGSFGKPKGLKCYKVNKESRGQWEHWGECPMREYQDVAL